MRRLLVLIASLAIALGLQAATIQPIVAHGNQPCYDGNKVGGLLSGETSPAGWASQDGAFANIDFHYDNCGDDDSAVAAWVALVPENTSGQIIQVGIVQCSEGWTVHYDVDPCYQHPNQLRYFFAYGGCTYLNGPYGQDAGPATAGVHSYKVIRAVEGWYMYLPSGTWFVAATNVAVSCIGSSVQTNVQWYVEKWDRGDSSGGSTTETRFTNMQHRTLGSGAFAYMNWGVIDNCHAVMSTAPHYSACNDKGSEMWAWD